MRKRGFTYLFFLLLVSADGERPGGPPRARAGAETYLAEVGEFDRVPGEPSPPRPYEPVPGIKGFYYQTKETNGMTYVRLKSNKWAYVFDYKIKTADIDRQEESTQHTHELSASLKYSEPAHGAIRQTSTFANAMLKAKSGLKERPQVQNEAPPAPPALAIAPCNLVSASVNFEWKNFKSEPADFKQAVTEVLSQCKNWQACNTSVQIAIISPWKKRAHGNPFKAHKYWGNRPPFAVMIERAKWIQNVMTKYGKVPATAFLPFKIDFDATGMQKTHISFK